ncbi:MAG: tetratricopeptide repeat protein [Rudaea sp.]
MTLEEILQLHHSGDLAAAEPAYRDYLQAEPDDAHALHLLGVLRQQRGDSLEAGELIRRAIEIAPQQAQFHLSLGGVLLHLNEDDAARASFERALDLDPNSVAAHNLVGHLHLREGDLGAAENRFKIGRRASAEDPLILLGLGNVHLDRNDAQNAAKFLSRAADLKPADAAIQTSLGRALFAQGAFAFAERAFENALRLRADLSIAKLYLARSKFRQGKSNAARDLFAELLAANQQTFGANAGLGDIARKKGQALKAFKFYRRALVLDPAHAGAANACAWCAEKLGDLEGAVRYLAEGLRHAPAAHELRRPLAELLDRLGRGTEAEDVRQGRLPAAIEAPVA